MGFTELFNKSKADFEKDEQRQKAVQDALDDMLRMPENELLLQFKPRAIVSKDGSISYAHWTVVVAEHYRSEQQKELMDKSLKIFEPEYPDLCPNEIMCDRPREPALYRNCPGSFDLVELTSKEEALFYFQKQLADGVPPEKVEREKKEFFEMFYK